MPRYLVSRSGLRAYASSLITDEITVVLLPDALAAVAAAEQEAGEQSHAHYMDGYAAALDAARDAVAAECIAHHGYTPGQTCPYCTDALAAIDALPALLAAVRAEEREAMADYWGNRSFDHFRDGLEQGRKEGYAKGLIEGDHGGRREGYRSGYAAGRDAVMTDSYAQAVAKGQRDEREESLGVGRWVDGADGVARWHHAGSTTQTSAPEAASLLSAAPVPPTSVAPAGEDYGALRWVTEADYDRAIEDARLQGQRDVFAYHPEWTVTGMCKPDCLPCQRLTELIDERSAGYAEGQRDEREACIAAVEALYSTPSLDRDPTPLDFLIYEEVIPAIRAREEKP